jgi:hypothetical protein
MGLKENLAKMADLRRQNKPGATNRLTGPIGHTRPVSSIFAQQGEPVSGESARSVGSYRLELQK